MSVPIDARVLMEGPRSYLREIQQVLEREDLESWMVAPPEGCGNT